MGLIIDYIDGQTPLDEDEKEGILMPQISTRGELDEFEQLGVENAIIWLKTTKPTIGAMHYRMFNNIWAWAGDFRKTNKNIGVDKYAIPVELRILLDDCRYWIENKPFNEIEIAIRASYRMVAIHPFANGNDRHSRLFADALMSNGFGLPYFTWGGSNLAKHGDARTLYLQALKRADDQDFAPLIAFAQS
jgi:Fic-DOC domain mobile mystery protein B